MTNYKEPDVVFPHLIDNSILKDFRACPQKAFRNRLQGLQPLSGTSIDLHFGTAFAKGVEAGRRAFHEKGRCVSLAEIDSLTVAEDAYKTETPELPLYTKKTLLNLLLALKYYWRTWPLGEDGLTPIEGGIEYQFKIELPFDHPVDGEPLYYAGRCDMVANNATGNLVIVDEKTMGKLSDAWLAQWDMDPQTTGYIWAMSKTVDEDVFCNAFVRGVVISSEIGHVLVPVFRTDWQLQLWQHQMHEDVERMLDCFMLNYWHYSLGNACVAYGRPCDYMPLCNSPNALAKIEQDYRIEFWSPHGEKERMP